MAICPESCPYAGNYRKCLPNPAMSLAGKVLVLWDTPNPDEERDGEADQNTDKIKLLVRTVREYTKQGMDTRLVHDFAVRCYPQAARVPSAAITACRGYFEELIAGQQPDAVFLVGDTSLRIATRKSGITKQCHKTFKHPTGIPMIPIISPNAVLHSAQLAGKFKAAVKYAVTSLEGTGLTLSDLRSTARVVVNPTEQDIVAFTDSARRNDTLIAFDAETTTLYPYVGAEWRVLCIGISDGVKTYVVSCDAPGELNATRMTPSRVAQRVLDLLTDKSIRKIAHNAKYDLHVLEQRYGIKVRPISGDTLIMHRALFSTMGGHDLKMAASELLGYPDYTEELKAYIGEGTDSNKYAAVPYPILAEYCGIDCFATVKLYGKLLQRFVRLMKGMSQTKQLPYSLSLIQAYSRVVFPSLLPLYKMEQTGFRLDTAYIKQLRGELEAKQQEALLNILNNQQVKKYISRQRHAILLEAQTAANTRKLNALAFNPNSPKQLASVLFERTGYNETPPIKTASGAASTSEEVLQSFIRRGGPIADFCTAVIRYRSLGKHLSTFVDGVAETADKTARVHSSYNLFGTVTGRGSCSNPNLQNIPRDKLYRNMFTAFPGDFLIEADYRQLELKLLAAYSNDPTMLAVYRDGRDLHTETAMAILGVDDPSCVPPEMRAAAKTVNFGIAYGLTAHGLALQLTALLGREVSETEAQPYIDAFYWRYPQVAEWQLATKQFAIDNGYVTTMFGTRRDIPEATIKPRSIEQKKAREEALRYAINTPIQGTGGLCTMVALTELTKMWAAKPNRKIVCYVHDSIVASAPRAEIGDAIKDMKRAMELAPLTFIGNFLNGVTLDVDVKFGKSWGSMVELGKKK